MITKTQDKRGQTRDKRTKVPGDFVLTEDYDPSKVYFEKNNLEGLQATQLHP